MEGWEREKSAGSKKHQASWRKLTPGTAPQHANTHILAEAQRPRSLVFLPTVQSQGSARNARLRQGIPPLQQADSQGSNFYSPKFSHQLHL